MKKIAWANILVLLGVALLATLFRGLSSELVIGWIALIILCVAMLALAYDYRREVIGALVLILLAPLFLAASFLVEEDWSVDADQFQDWALGALFFGLSLSVWAKLPESTKTRISWWAGCIAFFGFFALAAAIEFTGIALFSHFTGLLVLGTLGALFGIAEQRWKKFVSIAALVAMGALILEIYRER